MSHFTTIKTQFKDKQALIKALEEVGYTRLEQGTALPLYGYQGDKRSQTADIVIRRQYLTTASNDIGFKWNGEYYEVIISEYDRRALPQFLPNLNRKYAYKAIKSIAESKGFNIESEEVDEKGQVRIVLGRWT